MPLAFLRSLLLTGAFSFVAPLFLIGSLLISLMLVGQVPIIETIGNIGVEKLLQFLVVFGNGSAVDGALIIGCTCSLVGALFDTYAFYLHDKLHNS